MNCSMCDRKELSAIDFDANRRGVLKKACRRCCEAAAAEASRVAKIKAKIKRNKPLHSGNNYASRALILIEMGFRSYKEYLASDLWKIIRQRVFNAKGKRCWICGRDATEAHHNRYHKNDLTGKTLKYIVPICRECHQAIEFDGTSKTPLLSVKRKFKAARALNSPKA